MDSRRGRVRSALGRAFGLFVCGAAAVMACALGMWAALFGAVVVGAVLVVVQMHTADRSASPYPARDASPEPDAFFHRLLFDIAPTPLLLIDGDVAHALNRSARLVFATDDRVLGAPGALLDARSAYLRHEGRSWRTDRVRIGDGHQSMVALVDIEHEERAAEARAGAELIQVLGHELLNGLAPIVSLAESGVSAAEQPVVDPELMREIFGTLARRADSLHRFTGAYQELARLPAPLERHVVLREFIEDTARLFANRWAGVALAIDSVEGGAWTFDRDQLGQAIWALLQNAAESVSAGPSDHPRVTLTIVVRDDVLSIDVSDNGSGVPTDSQQNIFRPFHTSKPGGTGIGLSLARRIVQGHGGTLILARCRPATFTISLPASPAALEVGQRASSYAGTQASAD